MTSTRGDGVIGSDDIALLIGKRLCLRELRRLSGQNRVHFRPGAQNRAMAMPKRFRLSAHVALTLISFVTTGRAPRLLAFGARDLATLEKRTDRSRCSFDLCGAVDANP